MKVTQSGQVAKENRSDFPAYNVNCQIVFDAEDDHVAHIASIGYLGHEQGSESLSMRATTVPDQVVIFDERPLTSENGATHYRASITTARFHVIQKFLCAQMGNDDRPLVFINTSPAVVNDDQGMTYEAMLKRIAERNRHLKRTLSKEQRAAFVRIINNLGLGDDAGDDATPRDLAHPLHDAAIMRVPNDPASVFFTRMVTRPTAWETNENECHKFAQDGKAVVIYRPDEDIPEYWSTFRERVLQTLESRFNAMKGALVADVADILFWHWLSNERPSYANITLAQILEYRGVKARPNVIEEHWLAMRDVRAIKLRGGGIESEALFHISAAQPNLFNTAEPPKLATVYRYHPGYFLSEAIQRDAFFLAYYARNVWQLDYYRDANAKKLARVLRADWRRNAESYLPGGTPRHRTWRALLYDAGIDTESGEAVIHPMQFIKAIEKELEKLYQIEFVRECAPAIYHPDDQAKRANLPPKGKLSAWLALRTHIAPAADITDALTQTATRRLARKAELKALAEAPKKSRKPRKKAAD